MAEEQSRIPPRAISPADLRGKEISASIRAFIAEFSKESDRAAVILVGARLDYLLRELLENFLVPNTGSDDELLGTERPLGSFSGRIHAAYRLGLIRASLAHALHIFRRLRNEFAHQTAGSSVSEGPSRDRVRELSRRLMKFGDFLNLREQLFKGIPEAKANFLMSSAVLILRLEGACTHVGRLNNSRAYSLVPPGWKIIKEEEGGDG